VEGEDSKNPIIIWDFSLFVLVSRTVALGTGSSAIAEDGVADGI
jgi:hypothetical protein